MTHSKTTTVLTLSAALCVAGLLSRCEAEDLPPLPPAGYPLIESLSFPSDHAARKKWIATGLSAPVSVVKKTVRGVLKLPCRFKKGIVQRCAWDRNIQMDLADSQGLRFRMYSPDTSPISGFTFYLKSGSGWYSAKFELDSPGWSDVLVSKTDTRIEGTPAGWSKISAIRISAWRGDRTDTALYLADFGLAKEATPLVMIRNESTKGELSSVLSFSQVVGEHLRHQDIPFSMVSDNDVTPALLKKARVVILPHNPHMPDPQVTTLIRFIKEGGKLLSFYALPGSLAAAVDIRMGSHAKQTYPGHFASIRSATSSIAGLPKKVNQLSWNIMRARPANPRARVAAYWYNDKGRSTDAPAVIVSGNSAHMTHVMISDDPPGKRALLLAMLGHLYPPAWERAARRHVRNAPRIGPGTSLREIRELTRKSGAPRSDSARWVQRAERSLAEAEKHISRKEFSGAVAKAISARHDLTRAYCAVQQPVKGEHRGFWCHNAFGVDGMSWDQAVKILSENGFTAIYPNMLWAGKAYYRSKVLPSSPLVESRGDQIDACLAACRKYGIECHVWKVNWNTGGRAPEAFIARMKQQKRVQVSYTGKEYAGWLCPSHPANQKLEIDSMLEVARKYGVHGIHFDYIRYPDSNKCFCSGCRQRFEATLGRPVKTWPQDVRNDSAIRKKWLAFRRDNITQVVAAVSRDARKARPGIKISAAVFTNWPLDRDNIGQDWELWCRKGYLDFVCPMDYTPNNLRFQQMVRRQLKWAGKVPCYPGIGLSTWPERGDPGKLVDQIKITRKLNTGGFLIFQYRSSEANEIVPLCGLGITRKSNR